MTTREILHVDIDAFFAAVEQMDNPQLNGKPVIVGGSTGLRGVVSTASYEARRFGVHSAQPMMEARRLCPQGIFLKVRMCRYQEISRRIHKILSSYTPKVEPISIDEAFLDVTGCEKLFGEAEDIARAIKARIRKEIGLTCSVGIAPNKFLAKTASEMNKPDGLVVVREDEKESFLTNLPVSKIWGVGKATGRKLQQMGFYTIGDLRRLPLFQLKNIFGKLGARMYQLSRGIDDSPVITEKETKSISSETTFPHDISEKKIIENTLHDLSVEVASRLNNKNLWARSIQLKIRFADFKTITRSSTYEQATNSPNLIWQRARELLDKKADFSYGKVRLIGLAAFNLNVQTQMNLFTYEKTQRLRGAIKKIEKRYGGAAIRKGSIPEKNIRESFSSEGKRGLIDKC
jgi:DNA polymerase-4